MPITVPQQAEALQDTAENRQMAAQCFGNYAFGWPVMPYCTPAQAALLWPAEQAA